MTDGPSGLTTRLIRRLGSGSGPLWLGNAGTLALRVIQSVIIARAAGAHEFGLYVLVISYSAIFVRVMDIGAPNANGFLLRRDRGEVRDYAMIAGLHCLAATPLVALLWWAWSLTPLAAAEAGAALEGHLLPAMILTSVQLGSALFVPMLVPRSQLRAYAVVSCAIPLAAIALSLSLLGFTHLDASLLMYVGAGSEALGIGLALAFLIRANGARRTESTLLAKVKTVYAYGLKGYPGFVLKALSQRIDRPILATMISPSNLAAYGVGINLRDQFATPVSIQSLVVRNRLVDLVQRQGDGRAARRFLRRTIRNWALLLGPASLAAAAVSPWAVPFIYGPDFREAGPIAALLFLTTPFVMISTFSWCALLADEEPGLFSMISIATTLMVIGGAAVGGYMRGGLGAALGTLIATVLGAGLWYASAELHLRRVIRRI
ncbi:MAG: lipopolysaccharide biosynthesis protein [Caulobacter sp.]|nr:lipopolysaccharide biosynthesis protein [Caulobacter sp.]